MALADTLLSTVDKLLTKFDAADRKVYKRTVTRTGGDPLLGRGGVLRSTDTLLTPHPYMEVLTNASLTMGSVGSTLAQIGDYSLMISPSAMTRDELQAKDVFLVLKAGTSEEELQILSFAPSVIGGRDVAFEVLARSKKR